jgi:hypothetical protein
MQIAGDLVEWLPLQEPCDLLLTDPPNWYAVAAITTPSHLHGRFRNLK